MNLNNQGYILLLVMSAVAFLAINFIQMLMS